jgi:hypothetical protein
MLVIAANPSILLVPTTASSRTVCEELVEGFSAERVIVKLAGERADAVGCVTRKGPERARCLRDAIVKAKADGVVLVSSAVRGPQTLVTLQLLSRSGEAQRQETVRGPRPRLAVVARPAIARTMGAFRVYLAREKGQDSMSSNRRTSPIRPGPAPTAATAPIEEEPRATAETPAPAASLQPPRADAPVVSQRLEPPPASRPAAEPIVIEINQPPIPPPAARRSPVPGWIAAGVTVAAVGVAATFTGLALSNKAQLEATNGGLSGLSFTEAARLRDQTNLDLSIALGAGITVLVAGGTAGALWVQ